MYACFHNSNGFLLKKNRHNRFIILIYLALMVLRSPAESVGIPIDKILQRAYPYQLPYLFVQVHQSQLELAVVWCNP